MSACFSDLRVSSSSTRFRVASSSGVSVTCLKVSVRMGAEKDDDDDDDEEDEDDDAEDDDGTDAGFNADTGYRFMVSHLLLFPDDEDLALIRLLPLLSSQGDDVRCGVDAFSGLPPNPNSFRMDERSHACCGASDGEYPLGDRVPPQSDGVAVASLYDLTS